MSSALLVSSVGIKEADAQSCRNFWINPHTGAEECLDNLSKPKVVSAVPQYGNEEFSATNFSLMQDPLDPSGIVLVKGRITNTSGEERYISSITVELRTGDTTLTDVIIPVVSNLGTGKSRMLSGRALKYELNKVPLRQITVVPVTINYR